MGDDSARTPDEVIKPADVILALGWVLLLGGRWVVGSILNICSLVSIEQLRILDDSVLLPIYLIWLLFSVILVTLKILAARDSSKKGN